MVCWIKKHTKLKILKEEKYMEKYFFEEKPEDGNHAGNKARLDVDKILKKQGFIPFFRFETISASNLFEKIKYVISKKYVKRCIMLIFSRNYNVVIQYPIYTDRFSKKLLKWFVKNNNTTLIVHDIDSWRNLGKITFEHEKKILNYARKLIVHNDQMKNRMINMGVDTDITILGLFDYILDKYPYREMALSNQIVFAGNLGKSEFLKKKHWKKSMGININLYGPNYNSKDYIKEDFIFRGCFSPNEIPFKIQGSFGLVWDGDSMECCSGAYGEYLKYNNPHKLSLYIASGLPVIVWEKAAVADFVKKNKIGLCIGSLYDLKDVINHINNEQYQMLRKNVIAIQKRVVEGDFLGSVLRELDYGRE